MKLCQNIIAIVENLRIQSTKEILNPIHVDKFAAEKEVPIVPILVLSYVIKENVNPVSMRELWLHVNVEKAREWLNAVKKDKYSSAVKNVKASSTVKNINAKGIAIMEIVYLVRKNIW